jgi:uncharacterized phiE125 gp8 family phage protein
MAYCTAEDVKTYLGISEDADDALLGLLVTYAQKAVDTYTGRTFEASADATRYFSVGEQTKGRMLTLDKDLCAITSVVTNADDGSGGTALVQNTDYTTMPRNDAPYYALKLTASTTHSWAFTSDPDGAVTVTGKWAYSETAPVDVKHATIRLAAYMYRQRDAQVFDVTANPEVGVITLPQGLPKDVRMLLGGYKRML